MDVYACDVCGYYYDPEYGDEENNIKAGTAFGKLPKSWTCPECGADKSEFYRLDPDDWEYDDDKEEDEDEDDFEDS